MKLINKDNLSQEDMKILLEQYKFYVEISDRISQRRMNTNTFFISVNTLLLTIASSLKNVTLSEVVFIGILGCILSFVWNLNLNSYIQLNSGKYRVIHEIENLLPLSLYAYEWDILGKGKEKNKYWKLSCVEKFVPTIFCIIYIIFTVNCIMNICIS